MFTEEENGVEREVAEEERAAAVLLAEVVLLSGRTILFLFFKIELIL